MSNNDPVFPGVNDPSLADITVSEAKEVLGIDALVDQTELDTVEQNLESVDATLFASKADATALAQEVIDRANADIALATAITAKANATHSHSNATTSTPGFQSAADKLKLDGLSNKRREVFSGTTNASGVYSVTFSPAYSAAPNIQANIIGATDTQNIRITAISATGFTVTVRNRVDVVGLLPSWQNVNGAAVDVSVIEK